MVLEMYTESCEENLGGSYHLRRIERGRFDCATATHGRLPKTGRSPADFGLALPVVL
jgi:hypothetical protein